MSKKIKNIAILMIALIIVMAISGMMLTLSGGFNERTQSLTGIGTESEEGVPSAYQHHYLNFTVYNNDARPLKNVWVVIFSNSVAEFYGYTDEKGNISFELLQGEYTAQFEKYHYETYSTSITIEDEDRNASVLLTFEEVRILGSIPPWLIMTILGILAFGLIYFDRKKLVLGAWKQPSNWVGKSQKGSWTFIDKSTKIILYGMLGMLLIFLFVLVLPNFPSFFDMTIKYMLLGLVALICLLIEGMNKKYWIAAIGLGKTKEAIGDVLLGLSFALVFIGLTGFVAQLSIASYAVPIGSALSIIMIVIVASFFEESFFSGVLAPTIAEKGGIFPSIILTSIIFMFAHGVVYGWAMSPLINALLFRVCATIIVLYKKSWFGIFIAHALINALSLFSIMIFS